MWKVAAGLGQESDETFGGCSRPRDESVLVAHSYWMQTDSVGTIGDGFLA